MQRSPAVTLTPSANSYHRPGFAPKGLFDIFCLDSHLVVDGLVRYTGFGDREIILSVYARVLETCTGPMERTEEFLTLMCEQGFSRLLYKSENDQVPLISTEILKSFQNESTVVGQLAVYTGLQPGLVHSIYTSTKGPGGITRHAYRVLEFLQQSGLLVNVSPAAAASVASVRTPTKRSNTSAVVEALSDRKLPARARPQTTFHDEAIARSLETISVSSDSGSDDPSVVFLSSVPSSQKDGIKKVASAQCTSDEALAKILQELEEEAWVLDVSRKKGPSDEYYDVLEDFRKNVHDHLKERMGQLRIKSITENEHSKPGNPLYNRFVEAWQAVADQTISLVFHGTYEQNIEPICRDGLDPKRRSGQALGAGEYFGKDAKTSLQYCRGGHKMLVFAVLTDKSGLTTDQKGVLVIHKPDHQLPMFVVDFAVS